MLLSGTFLNSQIVPFPATPAPRVMTWTMRNTVATSTSAFTGQTQTQIWPGSWWEVKVEYPPLTEAQGEIIVAFLSQCYGLANVFQLGDPMHTAPRGSVAGSPLANGSQVSSARTMSLRGFTPNAVNVLLPGDLISPYTATNEGFGYRAYKCLDTVSADGGGNATFNIWPPIRETFLTGEYLAFTDVTATFRLKKNDQQWSVNSEGRLYGVGFECVEAL